MQPVSNQVLTAMDFSNNVFGLKKESFDNSLAKDVIFFSSAELIDREGKPTKHIVEIPGKEKVAAVFAQRVFDITTYVELEKISFKQLTGNEVKVKFISIETKKEQDGPVTYKYFGHFVVHFISGEEGGLKVNKIRLENTREVYEQFV